MLGSVYSSVRHNRRTCSRNPDYVPKPPINSIVLHVVLKVPRTPWIPHKTGSTSSSSWPATCVRTRKRWPTLFRTEDRAILLGMALHRASLRCQLRNRRCWLIDPRPPRLLPALPAPSRLVRSVSHLIARRPNNCTLHRTIYSTCYLASRSWESMLVP